MYVCGMHKTCTLYIAEKVSQIALSPQKFLYEYSYKCSQDRQGSVADNHERLSENGVKS